MAYPASIAIIPDGNRRFAEKSGLALADAYVHGFGKVEELMEWLKPTSVQSVRLWALSLENYSRRSSVELAILFELMKRQLRRNLADETLASNNLRIHFFGKTQLLPKGVQELMDELEQKTAHNERELGIAIAYSGQEELARAAKKAAEAYKAGEISDITEKTFPKYLYADEPVDLVIRTGGVQRLSGFMPWQNAYAEMYFSDKLWPEFDKPELEKAFSFYENTQRRFGK